jgi:hypothetical protein
VYGIDGTCRGYSQEYYNNLKTLLNLKEAQPQFRQIVPQTTWTMVRGMVGIGAGILATILILKNLFTTTTVVLP